MKGYFLQVLQNLARVPENFNGSFIVKPKKYIDFLLNAVFQTLSCKAVDQVNSTIHTFASPLSLPSDSLHSMLKFIWME